MKFKNVLVFDADAKDDKVAQNAKIDFSEKINITQEFKHEGTIFGIAKPHLHGRRLFADLEFFADKWSAEALALYPAIGGQAKRNANGEIEHMVIEMISLCGENVDPQIKPLSECVGDVVMEKKDEAQNG